jgi:methionyl-tRNA formyltransferase
MVTAAALRIVFFGTPEFAVPTLSALHDSRHPVVGVVTQPDRARGRGQKSQPSPVKQFALDHGLAVLQPERLRDEPFLQALRALDADLGVVAAYGRILTDPVLQSPDLTDQRPRVAAAEVPGRRPDTPRGPGRRTRNRRHDYASGEGPRRGSHDLESRAAGRVG